MRSIVVSGIFVVLTFAFFGVYMGVLSHVPYYHEQHHLFLFSEQYFEHTVRSKGLLAYVTDFIIQFFYIRWLGCLLLALMLSSTYCLIEGCVYAVSRKNDCLHLGLVPVIYLFLCTMSVDYDLRQVVGGFLFLLCLFAALSLPLKRWKYLLGACVCIAFALMVEWSVVAMVLVCLLLSLVSANALKNITGKYYMIITIGMILLYCGAGFCRFVHTYNIGERRMIQAQKYAREKDWDGVLQITAKYLQSGRKNQLMYYYYSLAIYHAGEMGNHLFDFPQVFGVKSLYFPWSSDSRETEFGGIVYDELGYWNEAQRWAFEAMTVWGETAPHLTDLARYNIKIGRINVARHFINILKQSLFYSNIAGLLEQELCSVVPQHIPDSGGGAKFANIFNIEPDLKYLCDSNPKNKMAFEYLMSYLLLSNQVVEFSRNLYRMQNFNYESMPVAYEEALYLYKLKNEDSFQQMSIKLNPEIEQRFALYYQTLKSGNMEQLKKQFGNSYWYYINFISPYGDKIIDREDSVKDEYSGKLEH